MIDNSPITIKMDQGNGSNVFDDALAIRKAVFVCEQGVLEQNERDEWDQSSIHFVAYINDIPIATVRVCLFEESAKICRTAVLKEYRRRGIATELCQHCIEHIKNREYPLVFLHSQTYIKSLYESLGFVSEGEEFLEENIPHVKMKKYLNKVV